jgi:hypothetical protein
MAQATHDQAMSSEKACLERNHVIWIGVKTGQVGRSQEVDVIAGGEGLPTVS